MEETVWVVIPDYKMYAVSNFGEVANIKRDAIMRVSVNNHGHSKVSLIRNDGKRVTRSVATLVAEAFVARPNIMCDSVIMLDGNYQNLYFENLAWRPNWFAWKYSHQLKQTPPQHYQALPVAELTTGETFDCVIDAGMSLGLLFTDVWRSTYTGDRLFPHGHIFTVLK